MLVIHSETQKSRHKGFFNYRCYKVDLICSRVLVSEPYWKTGTLSNVFRRFNRSFSNSLTIVGNSDIVTCSAGFTDFLKHYCLRRFNLPWNMLHSKRSVKYVDNITDFLEKPR